MGVIMGLATREVVGGSKARGLSSEEATRGGKCHTRPLCSEAPVFLASDRSRGIAEGNDASKVPCRTILPSKFMLERLQEAYTEAQKT